MLTESMLKCFMAVAETLNFTKAAEGLYLTQQAVSRNVSALENELQIKLLDRDTHFVRLTPSGEFYYQNIRHLFNEYIQMVGEMRFRFKESQTVLKIAIVDSPDFYRFQGAFHDYQKEQPDGFSLQATLDAPDKLQTLLQTGEVDTIVTMNCFVTETSLIESKVLQESIMKICVSTNNRRYEEGADWKHYVNEPLILQKDAGINLYDDNHFMQEMVKNLKLDPSAIILMKDVQQMGRLVEEGRGIMLCLQENPLFSDASIHMLEMKDTPMNYVLAWCKDANQDVHSKIKKLHQFLLRWKPTE